MITTVSFFSPYFASYPSMPAKFALAVLLVASTSQFEALVA